jgi:hypothetical protein
MVWVIQRLPSLRSHLPVGVAQLWIVRRHSRFMKKYTSPVIAALLIALFTGCSKHSPAATAPKFKDLGVVEVSDGTQIHRDLGGGRACVITPTVFTNGSVTLTIAIEETNSAGVVQTLATPRVHNMAGQQMAVSVGDIGIRLTPQIKP